MDHNYCKLKRSSDIFILMIILFSSHAFVGCRNNEEQTPDLKQEERNFMSKASLSNLAEVALGQLAQTKSKNDAVINFGKHMVNEHTLAQAELNGLATKKNVNIPQAIDSLHQAMKLKLSALSDVKFDSAYIHGQVMDHQKTQNDFEAGIAQAEDQDVKNYGNKYLPHIKMHLHMADSILNTLPVK
jgi:putative membrane protein